MLSERPVLLVDGMNIYMQMLHAYSHTAADGTDAGGEAGFLINLARYVDDMKPSRVCIAWEMKKSPIRVTLLPEYKLHRQNHLTNISKLDRVEQLLRIVNVLKHTPVCQVYLNEVEGDDVIAYLHNCKFRDEKKIIVSTDKDFYQLIDDKTTIFSSVKKQWINGAIVLDKYGIAPQNFAALKAVCGDPSDNIPGIPRFGEKTFKKMFPSAGTEHLTLESIERMTVEKAQNDKSFAKLFENIVTVKRNWQMVQLFDTVLTEDQQRSVDRIIDERNECISHEKFMKAFIAEKLLINQRQFIDAIMYLFETTK